MIKEAIEKIEAMAKPQVLEIGDHTFAVLPNGNYKEIHEDVYGAKTLELNSLDALCKMILREGTASAEDGQLFIKIPSHLCVEAFRTPDMDTPFERLTPYFVRSTDVPGWDAETKLTFERAAVALQTRFQDSEDRAYTLQLLSQITTGAKITYNDIGVATTIVTQKGVSLQANATIRPLVKLRPYRTFQEIEQPLGLFLIRIDERGISFVEADGGMWKLEARKTIKEYLEEHLADEIEAGRVTVML